MHFSLRIVPALLLTFFYQSVFSQCDTNQINSLNDRIMEVVYETPKKALKLSEENALNAEKCGHFVGQIRAVIRKGIAYDLMNEFNKSIVEYKNALAISKRESYQKGIASCQNNIGLIFWKMGNLNSALKYLQDAESSFKKQADYLNLAFVYNNIGLIYAEKNNFEKGIQMYRKSLRYSRLANNQDQILDVYSNLSNDYLTLEKYDSSLYYAELCLKGYQLNHNKYGEAITLNNMGTIFLSIGRNEEAIDALQRSRNLAKEIGNLQGFASTSLNLASVFSIQKKMDLEEKMLLEALEIAEKIESDELLYKIYLNLIIVQTKQHKTAQLFPFIEKYKKHHAKYTSQILDENITKMETQFEVKEEKERAKIEKQKANEKIEKQALARKYDNIIWISIVSFLFLIGVIIFILNNKANLKKELDKQKSIFQATIEERKRISYDLHDMLGSQLSYVVNNLEMMQLASGQNDRIDKTYEMSQEAMRSLRDTVWTLNTEQITLSVLKERMQNVSRKWLEESGIQVDFEHQFEDENSLVESNEVLQIMQIYQEAINNIRKHANTKRVKIIFVVSKNEFDLVLMDFGKGMDNLGEKPFHFGLKSMQERAQKLNAVLSFEKNPEGGLCVHLHWENKSNA